MNVANVLLFWLSTVCVALILFRVWKNRRYLSLISKLPGPSFLYIPISFLSFLRTLNQTETIIKLYENTVYKSHYPRNLLRCWIGPELLVYATSPETADQVLKNHLRKADVYDYMESLLGQGVFNNRNIPEWRKHRKLVVATFHFSALKSYVQIFHEEALILANKLQKYADGAKPVDPHPMLYLFSFSSLVRTSFDLDLKIQDYSKHVFAELIKKPIKVFQEAITAPWMKLDFIYEWFYEKQEVLERCEIAKTFIEEEIIGKIRNRLIAEPKVKRENRFENYTETILKEQLNSDNPRMSAEQLRDEVMIIMITGMDTLKSVNTILLYVFANYPEWQDQVYEECVSVLGDDFHKAPTYDQLQQLQILDRVIKETLRLFPAAPIIARQILEESIIGGHTIPADTQMIVDIFSMHRDPVYWTNPNQFDPNRFLPEEISKRNKKVYIPFSGPPPRNCLGAKYAMIQMKTLTSTLVRRFKFLPKESGKTIEDFKFKFEITISPLEGNDILMQERVV